MKSQSGTKQDNFVVSGRELLINFDHVEQTRDLQDEEGTETYWECEQVKVPRLAARDTIIEAIIAVKYPTYGAELAAIRNGGADEQAHSEWRQKAKQIAREWEASGG